MIFTVPFHTALLNYDNYAEALKKRGQCDNHDLLVITQRQDEEAATEFTRKVEKLFRSYEVKIVEAQPNPIAAANAFFKEAVYYFRDHKGDPLAQQPTPMLYGDPTWYPGANGWLDTIQGEFFSRGMPRVLCRWKTNDVGEKITWGPVVISKAHVLDCPLVPHTPARTHWRTYLRHELGNVAMASKSISTGKDSVLKPTPPRKK